MSRSAQEVTDAIVALGTDEVPFRFEPFEGGVVGVWDYADVKWAGFFAAGTIDKDYTLTITLHEDATYSLLDRTSETTSRLDAGGFHFEKNGFRGTTRQISIKKAWTPFAEDHGQRGNTYEWSFDTDSMKKPVQEVLADAGWTERKKGFFAKILGR